MADGAERFRHGRKELASQSTHGLSGKALSGSGEISGSIPEKVSGAPGHYGRRDGDDRSGGEALRAEGVMDGCSGWPSSMHDLSLSSWV